MTSLKKILILHLTIELILFDVLHNFFREYIPAGFSFGEVGSDHCRADSPLRGGKSDNRGFRKLGGNTHCIPRSMGNAQGDHFNDCFIIVPGEDLG